MILEIFKAIGALGLILVIIGILAKKRKTQSTLFAFGGICLEVYSVYIQDVIFMVLQFCFTVAAVYELAKLHKSGKPSGKSQHPNRK